LQSNRILKL